MTTATIDATTLVRSQAYCEQLTRSRARNFYYGLKLLPESKRASMFALYAYMRLIDDIADEDDGRSLAQQIDDLEAWRLQTHAVIAEGIDAGHGHEVWPAFAEMTRRHSVPARLFDDAIAGQRQDLEPVALENFEQLQEYCYRVAGVVGLASIFVWGFEGGAATEQLAIDRGVAFQLTNILRDLCEDARRARTYLPGPELTAAGVKLDDLAAGRASAGFLDMMRFQIERAEKYYEQSRDLEQRIDRDSRPTLVAMTEIYHGLLRKIAAEPQRVLRERVSLSLFSKLRIGWHATRSR